MANLYKYFFSALFIIFNYNLHAGPTSGASIYEQWFQAAETGNLELIEKLVNIIDINAQDGTGNTALLHAATWNRENIVKLLLNLGKININFQNRNGITALMSAGFCGHENIVKILLEVPHVKITTKDEFDVAHEGQILTVRYPAHIAQLIINKRDELTQKAFEAINYKDIETLMTIIGQIEPHIFGQIDSNGDTLLHKAFASNWHDGILLLLKKIKDPGLALCAKNNKRQTPLELINPTAPIFCLCLDLAFLSETDRKVSNLVAQEEISRFCAQCSKPNCTKRCSECKNIYYCSKECQKNHWNVHKKNCN